MSKETFEQCRLRWGSAAAGKLVGRTITAARYLSPEEMEELGWDGSALVIELGDGHWLTFSQDDEGNGPGACFTSFDDLPTIPVINDYGR